MNIQGFLLLKTLSPSSDQYSIGLELRLAGRLTVVYDQRVTVRLQFMKGMFILFGFSSPTSDFANGR